MLKESNHVSLSDKLFLRYLALVGSVAVSYFEPSDLCFLLDSIHGIACALFFPVMALPSNYLVISGMLEHLLGKCLVPKGQLIMVMSGAGKFLGGIV